MREPATAVAVIDQTIATGEVRPDSAAAAPSLSNRPTDGLPTTQKNPSTTAWLEALANRTAVAQVRFNEEISAADLDGAITPLRLVEASGQPTGLTAIVETRTAIDNLEQNFAAIHATAEMEIQLLPIDMAKRQALLSSFRQAAATTTATDSEWFSAQRAGLNMIERLVRFVGEHNLRIQPGSDDAYVFSTNEELNEYSQIVETISRLKEKESRIIATISARRAGTSSGPQ